MMVVTQNIASDEDVWCRVVLVMVVTHNVASDEDV